MIVRLRFAFVLLAVLGILTPAPLTNDCTGESEGLYEGLICTGAAEVTARSARSRIPRVPGIRRVRASVAASRRVATS